jgi:guanidinobutyrase
MATGAAPFDTLQVATWATCRSTPIRWQVVADHQRFYDEVLAAGCKPLTLGGDHTIALPILPPSRGTGRSRWCWGRAADINDEMFGEPIAHGTPFRRAVEEGLLACDKVWQIGLRGTGYAADDFDWPRRQGSPSCQRTRSGTGRSRR